MNDTHAAYKTSFEELINLFERRSDFSLDLEPRFGKGLVHVFNIGKGLQARLWDCRLKEGMEMYSEASSGMGSVYFTLAFFPNIKGVQFADSTTFWHNNKAWDTVFTSATSNYRLYLPPKARGHCLSISFSKKWFYCNVLEGSKTFKSLKEKIETADSFLLLESMTLLEKKSVLELLDFSWEKPLGTLYIKSLVHKIMFHFFNKIKEERLS